MMMTVKYSEMQGSDVVKVHSAAIHIEHKATLTQQKMWLYLLYRAYPRLKERVVHEVELPDVRRFLGSKMTGTNEFKVSLKALMGITLEWNIFGKDSEKWEAMPLISYCSIEKRAGRNVIRYRFTEELCERLYDPDMYVKINLLMSQNFKGKHAFNLYLLALDYLRVKDNFGYKHVTIDEIRKYLGIKPDDYTAAYDFKRYVLKVAEQEINKKSDINLKISDILTGGKISGFRFEMSIKEEFLPIYNFPEGILALAVPPEPEPEAPEMRAFSEGVLKFHDKHDVDVNAKPFREALHRAESQLGEALEDYLVHLVAKVKKVENEPFIRSVAGFYVSQLDDEGSILTFKRQQEQRAAQQAKEEQQFSELMDRYLEKVYLAQDRRLFVDAVSQRLDELAPQLQRILQEHGNTHTRQLMTMRYQGQLTKEALGSSAISILLYPFAAALGYTPLDFMAWKAEYVTDPANAEQLRTARQYAKEELRKQPGAQLRVPGAASMQDAYRATESP